MSARPIGVEGMGEEPLLYIRLPVTNGAADADEGREVTQAGGAGFFQRAALDAEPRGHGVGGQQFFRSVGAGIGRALVGGSQGLSPCEIRPLAAA